MLFRSQVKAKLERVSTLWAGRWGQGVFFRLASAGAGPPVRPGRVPRPRPLTPRAQGRGDGWGGQTFKPSSSSQHRAIWGILAPFGLFMVKGQGRTCSLNHGEVKHVCQVPENGRPEGLALDRKSVV